MSEEEKTSRAQISCTPRENRQVSLVHSTEIQAENVSDQKVLFIKESSD